MSSSGPASKHIDRSGKALGAVKPLLALRGKFDHSLFESIEGVVFSPFHVLAREPSGASLAHQNLAGRRLLAVKQLDSEVFWPGISS